MKYITETTEKAIEKQFRDDIARGDYFGAAASVCQGSRRITVLCGEQDPRTHQPITERTLFRLASMSKPITGCAVLRQVEKGKLSLDEEIRRYFPWIDGMKIGKLLPDGTPTVIGTASAPITVRQLLNHSSGLLSGELRGQYDLIDPQRRATLEASVSVFGETLLEFEPGSRHSYSSVGAYDVLSRLVELSSGYDFETYLQKEICAPLGMKDTTFLPTPEQFSRLSVMCDRDSKGVSYPHVGEPAHLFKTIPPTCFSGGAGLASTLHDYTRFAQMLLGGGRLEDTEILCPETFAHFFEPASLIGDWDYSWIFGLSMRYVVGPNRLPRGSFGWSGAYGPHFFVDPENGLCAVFLKNSFIDGGAGTVTTERYEEAVEKTLSEKEK